MIETGSATAKAVADPYHITSSAPDEALQPRIDAVIDNGVYLALLAFRRRITTVEHVEQERIILVWVPDAQTHTEYHSDETGHRKTSGLLPTRHRPQSFESNPSI